MWLVMATLLYFYGKERRGGKGKRKREEDKGREGTVKECIL